MDGSEYVSLLERAYGSSFDPSDDWTSEEIAWQLNRASQLGEQYEPLRKGEAVSFARTFIQRELLGPIQEALSDEHAAIVKNLPIGLVNIRTLNAQALRAPNGDPVIVFNVGILQIISHWWESMRLLSSVTSSQDEIAGMKHLLETYSFLLLLIRSNGRITYPQPVGSLSEDDMEGILLRSIQVELFILAHEVSHIILNHPLDSPKVDRRSSTPEGVVRQQQLSRDHELEADNFGYITYMRASPKHRFSGSETTIEDLLAPLEYFKIIQLAEKNPETIPDYGQNSNHPTAAERADMLLRLILYSNGGPEAAPEIAEACTKTWHILQSMPNMPEAFLELAESAGIVQVSNPTKGWKKWKRSR
jgi:hypothetical protein